MSDMNGMAELFAHLSDQITAQITAKFEEHLAEQNRKHEVIQQGMWKTIDVLHTIITTLNPTLEWLYDRVRDSDRAEAANRMDVVHQAMRSVDKLVEPMRDIMEGDK